MKKQLFALFAILVMAFTANAQTVKVSGTVSDANGPLPGAAIMVKGTTNGTVADLDGNYAIDVAPNGTLEISCMGYETVEQAVNGRSTINVTLSEDSTVLADAIVLGYGVATKKKDLSAAVGVVAMPEQLAQHPVTSTTAMLQGQIPGVTVQSNGGDPTAGQSLVIRGQGSPNGDSVLWVVDGVPGAPINSMNDIESIVVLKDAASAAIYGAQSGAGGVIIVTTKKASAGVSLSYDGLVGLRQAAKLPTPLNAEQQLDITKKAYENAGLPLPEGWDVTKNPYIATTRTNWMDEVFRNAIYHRHNVAFNAGTEKFKNRIALSLEDNQGVLYNTYNKRLGINYRGEIQLNKWVKFTEDLNWSTGKSKGADTDAATTGIIVNAIQMPSSASKYQYDGTGFGGTTTEDPEYIAKYGSNFSGIHGIVQNPLRQLYGNNPYNGSSNFYTTTGLEIGNIVKGLKFNSKFTYSLGQGFSKNFSFKRPEVGDPSLNNGLSYSASRSDSWKTENSLTFDRTFGKHSVGALLATTADHANGRGFNASKNTFSDESEALQYFAFSSSVPTVSDYYSGPDANVAVISRVSYSYNDRYFVTASWRRDYAGRLPEGHNYGDFPAFTGAWKVSSEPWFNNQSAVSFLKLRASWGRVGNLGSIGWNYKSAVLATGTSSSASIYGTENAGGQYGAMVWNEKALNPNLSWETSQQFNVGLDLGFFGDRLNASVDYYRKLTYNLIQPQTMNWPDAIGVSNMTVNLGDIANRGVEFNLGWSDKVGDFSYYINGNAAYNKNIVLNIGVTDADGQPATWDSSWQYRDVRFYNRTVQGGPLNQIYIIKCLGIFQSQAEVDSYVGKDGNKIQPNAQAGDLKFEDFNNDGKIDTNDRQLFGNATPDWTFALNFGFTWKKVSLSAMLQGVQGAQALNCGKMASMSMSSKVHNRTTDIYKSWSFDKNSDVPRLSALDNNNNFMTGSSWYLEDASYVRLKNLSVSYDFTDIIRKMRHFDERNSSCLLYFSGENLLTLTKYSGLDPECGQSDFYKYPVSRVLSFGIKLTY